MDNQEKQATLVTQDTGQTIGSKYTLEKTERQSIMDNQEQQATLVTQDTAQDIGSKYTLEKTERQSIMDNQEKFCSVSCVTNVACFS
jgi:hypothetical protein